VNYKQLTCVNYVEDVNGSVNHMWEEYMPEKGFERLQEKLQISRAKQLDALTLVS
jgi:hypothetical protein